MRKLGLALGLLLVTPGLAGCANPVSNEFLNCHGIDVETFTHEAGSDGIERGEGQPISLGVWVDNRNDAPIQVQVETQPGGNVVSTGNTTSPDDPATRLLTDEPARAFFPIQIDEPLDNGSIGLTVATSGAPSDKQGYCELDTVEHHWFDVADPTPAEQAEGGRGAIVHTIGWYTNGDAMFGTLERYNEAQDPPTNYAFGYTGEPIEVYVYNESSEEMPERYNESGYNTTIPGFNEALKGLSTVGGKIVHLEPEEAYTREGYEDHALYGEELVFYIEIVDVRTVPCELPQPICMPPDGADVPGGPALTPT